MTDAGGRRLAKVVFAFILLEFAVGLVFGVMLARLPGQSLGSAFPAGDLFFAVGVLLFPILGLVIATRQPHNALGWVMLAIGVIAFEPFTGYAGYALEAGLPGGEMALSAVAWTWVPVIGLAGTFVLLLFPDGHLPSPRWRWFAWTIGIGMAVASFAILFSPGELDETGARVIENRLAIEPLATVASFALVAILIVPIGIIGSAISLRARYRRGGATERLQIRWLASAAAIVATIYAIAMVFSLVSNASWGGGESGALVVVQNLAVLSFALIPLSIGVAVLRYRLYDIDLVIRKAVVVTSIAVFFTVVYAAIVGGIGALVQSYSTTTLSFVAAGVVALLFQPALAWSHKLAARIVYGRRATPYEVLSEFSEHVGGTYSDVDVLPRMARVVGEGVGAASARVWLERDGQLRVAASWGEDDADEIVPPVVVEGPELPDLPGADAAFAVEDQGELLGALAVAMPASDPMDEAKAKLVSDLAAQAGLVLRNVRLTEELRQRLVDLQAAQKRLVAAQDEERRKIERNIHDGAQQQLVALTVKMRLARTLATKDAGATAAMLEQMQGETQTALEDLRDLARGIYPPLLADQGLPAALEAQARRSAVSVTVESDGVGRYPQEVEAAVYFSVLEALQNVAKYAEAEHATVALAQDNGHLAFSVRDDGKGFAADEAARGSGLQGMADRLGALGGTVAIASAPGEGTVVAGRLPVEQVS